MQIKVVSRDPGIRLLRIGVAALLIIHGVYRVYAGGVEPFGGFLTSAGLPFGTGVAWLLTVLEIAGGFLLGIGLFVVPLVAWFGAELMAGIVLVHAREGWFVVGGGRNGVEYSIALLLALAAVALSERTWSKRSA